MQRMSACYPAVHAIVCLPLGELGCCPPGRCWQGSCRLVRAFLLCLRGESSDQGEQKNSHLQGRKTLISASSLLSFHLLYFFLPPLASHFPLLLLCPRSLFSLQKVCESLPNFPCSTVEVDLDEYIMTYLANVHLYDSISSLSSAQRSVFFGTKWMPFWS